MPAGFATRTAWFGIKVIISTAGGLGKITDGSVRRVAGNAGPFCNPVRLVVLADADWFTTPSPNFFMSEHYSSSLAHYFAKMSGSGQALGTAEHIALGADCVRPNDVTNCVELLPEISRKLSALAPESSFRRQVEQMALFVTETQGEVCRRPQREVVFALFYLLNRQDLIPDNVPEFGLLDDAHLVGIAYERNLGELRAHWTAKGRVLKSDGSE